MATKIAIYIYIIKGQDKDKLATFLTLLATCLKYSRIKRILEQINSIVVLATSKVTKQYIIISEQRTFGTMSFSSYISGCLL